MAWRDRRKDLGPRREGLSGGLGLYDSASIPCDPRETRGLPQAQYQLILAVLPNPRRLEVAEIQRLGEVLSGAPGFAERARRLGIDAGALAATVTGYSFAEKLCLVDAAEARRLAAWRVGRRRKPRR